MKPAHMRAILKRRDQFEQGLRELVSEGIADASIVLCNPKLAIFNIMGAINWSRKWYRPTGNWTGPQIAVALTQMLERSLSSTPSASLFEDPSAIETDDDWAEEPAAPRRRPA